MAKTFILTDGHNLFHRQASMTNPALGIDSMIGMALHMILYSMRKEYKKWNGTHTVFFTEGRSWRKDVYPPYKAHRKLAYAKQTEREQEDHRLLLEAFDDLVSYIDEKTNITVLNNPNAEADDMIALFIEAHPDDFHVLVSSDSDFFQLLKFPNLTIYDPIKDIMIKQDGIFNDNGARLAFTLETSAKIKVGKKDPDFVCDPDWYNYALFLKCIRGDKSDNIFSAYPGVREKGSKTTVGIREAYLDTNKGFAWNNFMLQKWTDHEAQVQRVKEQYELNKLLIDLSQIPDNIKISGYQTIIDAAEQKNVPAADIGHGFMRFCTKWDLRRISSKPEDFMPMLKAKYD